MLDIRFLRENPDVVKQNIKNKFQDKKLPLVDEVYEKLGILRNMNDINADLTFEVLKKDSTYYLNDCNFTSLPICS
mgnify:CR=1 FL=1